MGAASGENLRCLQAESFSEKTASLMASAVISVLVNFFALNKNSLTGF
jgi:hypothetical protein